MTGSQQNLEIDDGMMRALTDHIEEDGQMYYPFDGAGPPKGTSYPQINALTVFAMLNFHARDGDPEWLEKIDLLCKGLRDTAIQVEDRAFYPMQSGITRDGSWHFMHHQGDMPIPYTPPDEPQSDAEGLEGAAKSDQIRCMSALAKHYRLTGDKQSLEIARKISRFVMKPGMWSDTSEDGYPGHEHGIWSGHFHNGTQALMGLLDLAEATNDDKLRQIVREGYDQALRQGVIRIGWFPAWSNPTKYNRPANLADITEPCALADAVCLAVMMSDAGLGDYWDDVDSVIRNTLLAQQVIDMDEFRSVAGIAPGTEGDQRLQRFLGGFVNGSLMHLWNDMPGCCTANGGQSIYYAWHGITRFNDGIATVNLFLNRVSPWMDVVSYLPFEGRVELHNKQAHTAMVRIPGWVDRNELQCFVNGQSAKPARAGNYLLFEKLADKDKIRLEFPVREREDQYTINNKKFKIQFRGSTVVGIEPIDEVDVPDKAYRIDQHDHLLGNKAPMRTVKRYVTEKLIPLGTF